MKVRSLRQALHWLFLVVGAASLILLAFSALTYLDYSREGYGLEVSVTEAWLTGNRLVLRLQVDNPGGMDLVLGPEGNLTMAEKAGTQLPEGAVPAHETTEIIVSFILSAADLQTVRSTGMADFSMDIRITVDERDAVTNLHLDVHGLAVDVSGVSA
jgi:hypothetical protein